MSVDHSFFINGDLNMWCNCLGDYLDSESIMKLSIIDKKFNYIYKNILLEKCKEICNFSLSENPSIKWMIDFQKRQQDDYGVAFFKGLQINRNRALKKASLMIPSISITVSAVENLQAQTDLAKVWPEIKKQLPSDLNLTTIEEVRNWINDDKNLVFLNKIKKLNLSNIDLEKLPLEVIRCSQIEYLDLGVNGLTALPEEIGQLQKMQFLYILCNEIVFLPKSIMQLTELKLIDMSCNKLTQYPEELSNLPLLQIIRIENNSFNLSEEMKKINSETESLRAIEETD